MQPQGITPVTLEAKLANGEASLVLTWVDHSWGVELRPGLNRLGRNPTNDFRVPEGSVSSFHCEIEVQADLIMVHDLGSTNGSFINGIRVQDAELHVGDVLRLGNNEFKLAAEVVLPAAVPLNMEVPSGPTRTIPPAPAAAVTREDKPKGFLGRLTQTLRLNFRN